MFSKQDLQSMLNIIAQAGIKGSDAMVIVVLQQKIQNEISRIDNPAKQEKPKIQEEIKKEKKS